MSPTSTGQLVPTGVCSSALWLSSGQVARVAVPLACSLRSELCQCCRLVCWLPGQGRRGLSRLPLAFEAVVCGAAGVNSFGRRPRAGHVG